MYSNLILTLPGSIHLEKSKARITRQEVKRLVHLSMLPNPAIPNFNTSVTRKYSKVTKTIPIGPKMDISNIHAWAEDMRLDNQALSYRLV